ncbi:MAG: carbohydrate kinase family protein [Candidatus Bathyarchaeia archaeon]
MTFDVVCFGALNIDKLYKVNHIARAEEESEILDFKESPGGSAANTAVGLARLGVKTGFIGKVAAGRDGEYLLEAFRTEGVDTGGIVVSKSGRCGSVIGFVDEAGQRALYLDPGVNSTLKFEEIDADYVAGARFIHLTSFASNVPFEAQLKLVEKAREAAVSLDPGMIYAQKGFKILGPLIGRCFAVLPNENELRLLTGKGCEEGAKALLAKGVKVVAVKLGERGCYVTDGKESHYVSSYKVNVVDTTGAGDAFCAGFLYGLLNGKTLKQCGILGNFVASRVITEMGARNGLPRKEELPL